MQWQPIETAPKDGLFICTGHFYGDPANERWHAIGFLNHQGVICQEDGDTSLDYATHWMPLPDAPK